MNIYTPILLLVLAVPASGLSFTNLLPKQTEVTLNTNGFDLRLIEDAMSIFKVELLTDLSAGLCTDENYGFFNTVVWTTRGCLGTFKVWYIPGYSYGTTLGGLVLDRLETTVPELRRITSMFVTTNYFVLPCVQGLSYGFSGNTAWTGRGCVADFIIAGVAATTP